MSVTIYWCRKLGSTSSGSYTHYCIKANLILSTTTCIFGHIEDNINQNEYHTSI